MAWKMKIYCTGYSSKKKDEAKRIEQKEKNGKEEEYGIKWEK